MFDRFLKIKETDGRNTYLLKSVVLRTYEHNITQVGGELSFFLILSAFPFLIFLNAIVASFSISTQMVNAFFTPLFPKQIVDLISKYVEYISENRSLGVVSAGIVVTVFSASKAMRAINRGLNTAYGNKNMRSFWGEILFSMALICIVGLMLTFLIVFVFFSTDFVSKLALQYNIPIKFVNIADAWRWVMLGSVIFFLLSMMYKFVPKTKLNFHDIIPGTVFGMIGFMIMSIVFSVYAEYFVKTSALYGTLGSVILLLFWLYAVSIIILIGAEINGAVKNMPEKYKKKADKPLQKKSKSV